MKKFIHLKRIMIESGEEYGLGFPSSPKTPNTVSQRFPIVDNVYFSFALSLSIFLAAYLCDLSKVNTTSFFFL